MAHYRGHGRHAFVKLYPGFTMAPWKYTLEEGESWRSNGRLMMCFAEGLPARIAMDLVPSIEMTGTTGKFGLSLANFGAPVTFVFAEQDGVTFTDFVTYPKDDPANEITIKTGQLVLIEYQFCLLYTSPSPRDRQKSRMPSSA